MKSQSAFTLVELITVLALVSILAAVATPRYVLTATFDTRGILSGVQSSLQYAQKTAIAQHRNVYVLLDAANKVVRLCYDSSCNSRVIDPVTLTDYQLNYSSAISVTASQVLLGFNATGTPLPNATATYNITNTKNATQTNTVQIEADTGYIRQL